MGEKKGGREVLIEPRERGSGGKSGRWGWSVCVWVGERGERDPVGTISLGIFSAYLFGICHLRNSLHVAV